jgi:hypothetical protein
MHLEPLFHLDYLKKIKLIIEKCILFNTIPKADVASSSSKSFGLEIKARAIATIKNQSNNVFLILFLPRCFCPPLSLSPDEVL